MGQQQEMMRQEQEQQLLFQKQQREEQFRMQQQEEQLRIQQQQYMEQSATSTTTQNGHGHFNAVQQQQQILVQESHETTMNGSHSEESKHHLELNQNQTLGDGSKTLGQIMTPVQDPDYD